MIYLKAKIQALLDEFEWTVESFGKDKPTAVEAARQAILDYWERGEV